MDIFVSGGLQNRNQFRAKLSWQVRKEQKDTGFCIQKESRGHNEHYKGSVEKERGSS